MDFSLSSRSISRRTFLHVALGAAACSLLPLRLGALSGVAAAGGASLDNYYLKHQKTLLKAFDDTNAGARVYLAHRWGGDLAQTVTSQAAQQFRVLLPELPDVGGVRNLDIEYLPIAAWYVAYYRPLRELGKTAQDVGRMIYDLNARQYTSCPREQALAQGAQFFTPESIDQLRRFAAWTQQREYPGNWVATFIPGDSKNFDF